MTIPADIGIAVRLNINPGDAAVRFIRIIMALATKRFFSRLLGFGLGRVGPVIARDFMADDAGQSGMMRNHLLGDDFTVAGRAFFGCMGQDRGVRVMALLTGLAGTMHDPDDLGETRGPRRIVAVTLNTQVPVIGDLGQVFIRLFGMFGRWTMTGLA